MAEKSFADYVKDVMSVLPSVDRSNMLAPTTMSAEEVAAYRANPFYKQEEIRQRIAAEEAAKTPTTPISQGMMTGGGGDSFQGQQGAGFYDVQPGETPAGRDARVAAWAAANPGMAKVTGWAQDWWAKTPYGQLQNKLAPEIQQNMNLSNLILRHQQNSRYGLPGADTGGITYAELDRIAQTYNVPALSQQALMLAQQEAGMFDTGGGGGEAYSGSGYNSSGDAPSASDYGFGGF